MARILSPAPALFACLCLFAVPMTRAQSPVVVPETIFPELADLLAEAATQSPRMLAQAINSDIFAGNVQVARAGMLPQLGASVTQTWGEEERTSGQAFDTDKLAYQVSLSQPLYHWGTLRNNLRVAKLSQLIGQGRTEEAYNALAAEVRAQYLQLIRKQQTLELLRFRQIQAERRLAQGRERVEARTVAAAEIFPLEIAADRADLAVLEAEADMARSQRALARLVGRSELGLGSIPAEIPPLDSDAGVAAVQALAQALRHEEVIDTRALAALRRQLEISQMTLHNTRMGLRPRFNLVVAMTQDEQTFGTFPITKYESRYTYGGVRMSWTIFDSFRTKGAVRSALGRLRSAERDLSQAEEDLIARVGALADQVQFSARNLQINERLLQAAEGGLKFQQDQFAMGNASEGAVTGARDHLHVALGNTLNTRYAHLMLLVQFLGAIDADPAVDRFFVNP
jgi:outer membrane protein TolC